MEHEAINEEFYELVTTYQQIKTLEHAALRALSDKAEEKYGAYWTDRT